MEILLIPLFLIILIIALPFAIKAQIKADNDPTFAGYLVKQGRPTDEMYFIKIKDGDLVIANFPSKKEIYKLKINEIFFEITRAVKPDEITEKEKSVVGRAIVGGLILGPVGAIVGGISGIGTKQKFKKGEINTFVHVKSFDEEFLFKPALGHERMASLLLNKYRKLKNQVA